MKPEKCTYDCTQKEVIHEIRADVKELLKFKNTALGIIIGMNVVFLGITWVVSNVSSLIKTKLP